MSLSRRRLVLMMTMLASLLVALATGSFRGRANSRVTHRHTHKPARVLVPETGCGPISLAIIGEYLDKPTTIAEYHKSTRAGALGTCSVADLLRALGEHGLPARAVRYDPKSPPMHRLPMVLFLDGAHFLAALPGPAGQVVLVYPPSEPQAVPWSSLESRWRGEAIVVGPREEGLWLALGDQATTPAKGATR